MNKLEKDLKLILDSLALIHRNKCSFFIFLYCELYNFPFNS